MTKINYEFIQKIFNRKIELKKKEDKIKLSKYSEYIPMYDIYSDNIYPISNLNIHYRLFECHYRFVTSEVKKWIENKLKKIKISSNNIKNLYKKNLDIINNYDLETLEKTSYQTLYRYSPKLGLSISICKRNSFNPYARHLKPYYTKNELIKLGMNNTKLHLNISKISPKNLIDKELHYKICKTVSKNDVSVDLINKHINHIIKNKIINWITFYSMTGSYIFNDYLRNHRREFNTRISEYMYEGLKKIINVIGTSDSFKDNFYFYRFIWDDDFLRKLKVGDTFKDKGFLSTTRDPFYTPGTKLDFGLVLIKINVPKNIKGVGLFIENFSMFPKEEEFLICPNTKLKLIAKDDKFTYHHINSNFEKHVTKKYEFDLIDNKSSLDNFIKTLKYSSNNDIPEINLETLSLMGRDRIDLFNSFLKECDELEQFRYNDNIYICQMFDSTSSYQHLFYNKTKNGLSIVQYDNGYPIFSLECGEKLVVNFRRTFTFYDDINEDNKIDSLNHLIGVFCKIFKYEKAIVFFPYSNFTQFKKNYDNTDTINYLYTYLYCHPIYNYYKNGTKYYHNKFYKYLYGYWKLDKIGKEKIPEGIKNKLPEKLRTEKLTWKELLIEIIEKYFYLYPRMESWFNYHNDNIFKKTYVEFDGLSYLRSMDFSVRDFPTIEHTLDKVDNKKFKLVFDRRTRRIN